LVRIVKFGNNLASAQALGVDWNSLETHGLQWGCPQALLFRVWWGDDVRGVNQEGVQ
jgi:hypothetical protein